MYSRIKGFEYLGGNQYLVSAIVWDGRCLCTAEDVSLKIEAPPGLDKSELHKYLHQHLQKNGNNI